jgi:hypothetical protein
MTIPAEKAKEITASDDVIQRAGSKHRSSKIPRTSAAVR